MIIGAAFGNPYIFVTMLAWFVAQAIKVILVYITNGKPDFKRFIGSGGMPSSHAATVVALTTSVGRTQGTDGVLFAICLIFSLIVMYDAAGVRRAAGKQAHILNRLMSREADNPEFVGKQLGELIGHTPVQVIAGAALGFAIAMIFTVQHGM